MVCVTELLLVINSFTPRFKNKETVFREASKSPWYPFTLEGPRLFPFWKEPCPSWEDFGGKAKEKMDRVHEHHVGKVGGR